MSSTDLDLTDYTTSPQKSAQQTFSRSATAQIMTRSSTRAQTTPATRSQSAKTAPLRTEATGTVDMKVDQTVAQSTDKEVSEQPRATQAAHTARVSTRLLARETSIENPPQGKEEEGAVEMEEQMEERIENVAAESSHDEPMVQPAPVKAESVSTAESLPSLPTPQKAETNKSEVPATNPVSANQPTVSAIAQAIRTATEASSSAITTPASTDFSIAYHSGATERDVAPDVHGYHTIVKFHLEMIDQSSTVTPYNTPVQTPLHSPTVNVNTVSPGKMASASAMATYTHTVPMGMAATPLDTRRSGRARRTATSRFDDFVVEMDSPETADGPATKQKRRLPSPPHALNPTRRYRGTTTGTKAGKKRGSAKKVTLQMSIDDITLPGIVYKAACTKHFSNKHNVTLYERANYAAAIITIGNPAASSAVKSKPETLVILFQSEPSKKLVALNSRGERLDLHPRFLLSTGKSPQHWQRTTITILSSKPRHMCYIQHLSWAFEGLDLRVEPEKDYDRHVTLLEHWKRNPAYHAQHGTARVRTTRSYSGHPQLLHSNDNSGSRAGSVSHSPHSSSVDTDSELSDPELDATAPPTRFFLPTSLHEVDIEEDAEFSTESSSASGTGSSSVSVADDMPQCSATTAIHPGLWPFRPGTAHEESVPLGAQTLPILPTFSSPPSFSHTIPMLTNSAAPVTHCPATNTARIMRVLSFEPDSAIGSAVSPSLQHVHLKRKSVDNSDLMMDYSAPECNVITTATNLLSPLSTALHTSPLRAQHSAHSASSSSSDSMTDVASPPKKHKLLFAMTIADESALTSSSALSSSSTVMPVAACAHSSRLMRQSFSVMGSTAAAAHHTSSTMLTAIRSGTNPMFSFTDSTHSS